MSEYDAFRLISKLNLNLWASSSAMLRQLRALDKQNYWTRDNKNQPMWNQSDLTFSK